MIQTEVYVSRFNEESDAQAFVHWLSVTQQVIARVVPTSPVRGVVVVGITVPGDADGYHAYFHGQSVAWDLLTKANPNAQLW